MPKERLRSKIIESDSVACRTSEQEARWRAEWQRPCTKRLGAWNQPKRAASSKRSSTLS